jgi:hypothetical protein
MCVATEVPARHLMPGPVARLMNRGHEIQGHQRGGKNVIEAKHALGHKYGIGTSHSVPFTPQCPRMPVTEVHRGIQALTVCLRQLLLLSRCSPLHSVRTNRRDVVSA